MRIHNAYSHCYSAVVHLLFVVLPEWGEKRWVDVGSRMCCSDRVGYDTRCVVVKLPKRFYCKYSCMLPASLDGSPSHHCP